MTALASRVGAMHMRIKMETARWVYKEGKTRCCVFPPGSLDIYEKDIHKEILPIYTKNFFFALSGLLLSKHFFFQGQEKLLMELDLVVLLRFQQKHLCSW